MAQEREDDLASAGLPTHPSAVQASRTNRNLWLAFTEEAKANRLYLAYAMKAFDEGFPEVAEVFLEVSGAETAHALAHLRVLGEVKSTRENLSRVIDEETRESSVMYPRMVRQAESEGRADAADAFRLAFEAESRHARLFGQAFETLRTRQRSVSIAPALEPGPAPIQVTAPVPYENVQSERERVAGLRRIRELVFGAQDGLISTVTIAATVMAATREPHIAILGGVASAMAGTISMAAGTFLGSRAASQMEEAELDVERRELIAHPEEEHAELVAAYRHDGYSLEEAEALADRVMQDRELALRVLAERELGITPEMVSDPRKDAGVMGASFFVGGLIPLAAYVLLQDLTAIPASIGLTLVALAAIGVAKARTAHRPVLPSVLEVSGIGGASGALGYLLGDWLPRLLGVAAPS